MEEDIEVTDINVRELEIDIKAIKSLLKELETERDDIQLICIRAELELSIKNILNRLEQQNNNINNTIKAIEILRQDFSEDLQVEFINLLNTLTGGEYLKW